MQNKCLYLHFGWPKTATSSLQLFFALNQKPLEQQGVYYPDFIGFEGIIKNQYGQGNGYPLAYNLLENKSVTVCNYDQVTLSDLGLLLRGRDDNILLSSEWFTEISIENLDLLLGVANANGYKCKVIIYIRSFIDYFNSEKSQAIKIGRNLESVFDLKLFDPYESKLKAFQCVFGKENVVLRPFHKDFWVDGDIVKDLLSVINVRDAFERVTSTNISPHPYILALHKNLLRFDKPLPPRHLELLSQLSTKNGFLSDEKLNWYDSESCSGLLGSINSSFYRSILNKDTFEYLVRYECKNNIEDVLGEIDFYKYIDRVYSSRFYLSASENFQKNVVKLFNYWCEKCPL